MLPSRFNDALLDSWKNGELSVDYEDLSLEDDEFDSGRSEFDGSRYMKDIRYGSSDLYLISKKREEREMDYVGTNSSFDYGNYLNSSLALPGTEEFVPGYNGYKGLEKLRKGRAGKRKDVYKPEDFALGDIVWAKCGKRYPTWPAIVIDPILQAPEAVLSCCVPGAICVMFFGYSKNGTQRVISSLKLLLLLFSLWLVYLYIRNYEQDYAWVKQGMIFPFAEFMDRCVLCR